MIIGAGRRRQILSNTSQNGVECIIPDDIGSLHSDCDVDSDIGELLENQLEQLSEEELLEPWVE